MSARYNLNRLTYFAAVIEEGTITAAAERLGMSKAVVSKQLQLLEQELGVALLLRNTRHMRPTEAGQVFYEKSKSILIQADEAFNAMLERGQVPTGRVRVTAPVDYGIAYVAPLVARFCEQYPRVNIELVLSDDQLDIVEQRYDIAFRVGWLQDSGNLASKLRDFAEIAVCTPETLEQWTINSPDDLAELPFVANLALGGQTRWTFSRADESCTVDLHAAVSANITLAIRSAIVTGQFFTILPDFLVSEELEEGNLVQLLPDWDLRSGGVYIVSPPSRLRSGAAQALIDMARVEAKDANPSSSHL